MLRKVIMILKLGISGFVLSFLLWGDFPTNAAMEPQQLTSEQRAFQIAEKQPHLKRIYGLLKGEAQKIADRRLREEGLSLLDRPKFTVITAQRSNESSIVRKLIESGLLSKSSKVNLFPQNDPMPFLGAPGSSWLGHHSYPGGLVFHTYTNLRLGIHYADTYQDIYQVKLRQDFIRLAAIWHDSAKTVTLPWSLDGSCAREEVQIAGTSAHHIWGIAEALHRKLPTEFIVILASAHSPPVEGTSLENLIQFLKAGAILAGVSFESAGLRQDGKGLLLLPPIEAFVNHLADHDYLLTESSLIGVDQLLGTPSKGGTYWKRNEILSEKGDLHYYQSLQR